MALVLAACTDRTERNLEKEAAATPNVNSLPAPISGTTDTSTAGANMAPAATAPANGSVALNPEHGQPGHRCDIPVGAPLNGGAQTAPSAAPAQPQNMPAGPRVQSTPAPSSAPAKMSSQVKLNPPHGEPGHDCAVPVGQPLPAK